MTLRSLVNVPERLTVVSGHVNLHVTPRRQGTRVTEIILHPDNDYIYRADIALLRLQQPLAASATVRPACLPQRVHQWSVNLPCYVSGWGVTDIAGEGGGLAGEGGREGGLLLLLFSSCFHVLLGLRATYNMNMIQKSNI